MKKPNKTSLIFTAALTLAVFLGFSQTDGRDPTGADADAHLRSLITQIETQQQTMVDNQTKAEVLFTDIEEQLRQARIFVSRAGGGKR